MDRDVALSIRDSVNELKETMADMAVATIPVPSPEPTANTLNSMAPVMLTMENTEISPAEFNTTESESEPLPEAVPEAVPETTTRKKSISK